MNQQGIDLERFRDWVQSYDGLPAGYKIDFTSELPDHAGIFPSGLQELRRTSNLWGDVTVFNQYNFAIYRTFAQGELGMVGMTSQEWVIGLQSWVQEQSVRGLAPTFGNIETQNEVMKAQNGQLYGRPAEGVAMYLVQVAVQFKTFYGE